MASTMAETNEINNSLPSTEKHMLHADSNVATAEHLEGRGSHSESLGNIVYTNEEEEPELHLPTWIALGSIYLLLAGQGLAFQGPPAVVSDFFPRRQALKCSIANQIFLQSSHSLELTSKTQTPRPGSPTRSLWYKQ